MVSDEELQLIIDSGSKFDRYYEDGLIGQHTIQEAITELLARRDADKWNIYSEKSPLDMLIVLWRHPSWKRSKEGYIMPNGRLKVWGGEYNGLNEFKWRYLPEPPVQS
jgi:hypothetical protein